MKINSKNIDVSQLIQDYKDGMLWEAMEEKYNYCYSTLLRFMKKEGMILDRARGGFREGSGKKRFIIRKVEYSNKKYNGLTIKEWREYNSMINNGRVKLY